MNKIRDKRIHVLKIEIETLEKDIICALTSNKKAFANRLILIKELKEEKLENWIRSP